MNSSAPVSASCPLKFLCKGRMTTVFSCAPIMALAFASIGVFLPLAQAQEVSGEQARGMFLDSRRGDNKNPGGKSAGKTGRIGLGYTIFQEQRDAARRVNPDHVFHSGDRVRILVETNCEVYLYVFHQEGNSLADLLFPDARIHRGDNVIQAHHPSFIPGTGWFAFDNQAADEKLTLVASEKPLEGVPRTTELKATEAFHIDQDKLARLVANSLPALQDAQSDEGKLMTANEGTRGLALTMNDPQPSRLIMNSNASRRSGWITAQVVLVHR
jgi:hypothetical protein